MQFTNLSQNAVGWSWRFGDGATSNEQSPSHTYFAAGNYNVNLTVNNANGTASKSATITVFEEAASSSVVEEVAMVAGAGGSPEPQSNVQPKNSHRLSF